MKVKVEFIVETEDYGAEEFQKEIEALIEDIDPEAVVLDFKMYEVAD
jgi:hypothetical protein